MSDDAELQARIAALTGQINNHRQQGPHRASHAPRAVTRWSPYGRGGRAGFGVTHQNRTLVLGGNAQHAPATPLDPTLASAMPPPAKDSFVSTRGVGVNQLMTQDTYKREQKQKMEYQDKQQIVTRRQTPEHNVEAVKANQKPALLDRVLEHEGVQYRVAADGSKLTRISDDSPLTKETPKKTKIADVEFFRTKRGNLIRANSLKGNERTTKRALKPQCEIFTRHGTCSFGPACRFTHDPKKIAICKDFLRNGTCNSGRNCDLSHELTYHRVPACTHFLRGNCTKNACRYPHIHVSPAARVCPPFATLGFCAKGPECGNRHVFECPDYSNHGHCAKREEGSCSLPHVDRAANLRKAAKRQSKTGLDDESDVSSNDEEDDMSQDVEYDSDVAEEDVMGADGDSLAISQQHDFVGFN